MNKCQNFFKKKIKTHRQIKNSKQKRKVNFLWEKFLILMFTLEVTSIFSVKVWLKDRQ